MWYGLLYVWNMLFSLMMPCQWTVIFMLVVQAFPFCTVNAAIQGVYYIVQHSCSVVFWRDRVHGSCMKVVCDERSDQIHVTTLAPTHILFLHLHSHHWSKKLPDIWLPLWVISPKKVQICPELRPLFEVTNSITFKHIHPLKLMQTEVQR